MLFSMLRLRPKVEKSPPTCEDLRLLKSMVPVSLQGKIANVLIEFINLVLPYRDVCMECQWLYVIPLVHVLKRPTLPFASLYENEVKWMDKDIDLAIIKRNKSFAAQRYIAWT